VKTARILVVLIGILLPYLARIPGVFLHGANWFTSYLGSGLDAFVLLGVCNALCWGAILAASFTYRHARSVWFPAVLGFGFLALSHAFLDLSSNSTAAISLIFIPIFSLPLVIVGWLAGLWYDRRLSR
jgi:hypothetical protein